MKSPCMKVCKLVKRKCKDEEFCVGCGRSRQEIKMWKKYSDEERDAIIERLRVQ